MALRYGFYNSINNDRKYDALDMSSLFDGIIEDGVFETIGKLFAITPGEGLQVIVDTGKAWFNHTWTSNDAPFPLDIDAPDITLSRYDAVVLEVNNSESIRANSIKIVKGTASSDPQKPIMTNSDLVHQHPLAYILVESSAESIKGSNIQMLVGSEECPFVTGSLETVSIDALFARWEAEFDEWFVDVRTTLEGDVAGNLLKKIYDLDDKIDDRYEKTLDASTKESYELPPEATPSDAFAAIKNQLGLIMGNKAQVTVTVKTTGGTPLEGILVSGILSSQGTPGVTTDSSGKATGTVSSGSVTLSVSGYADLSEAKVSFTAVKGETYEKDLTVSVINFVKYTASKQIKFSKNVETIDASCIAAGGGGSGSGLMETYSRTAGSGSGGGAGDVATQYGIEITPEKSYSVVVGAGGLGGTQIRSAASDDFEAAKGKKGGDTSFDSLITATGGNGGTPPVYDRTGNWPTVPSRNLAKGGTGANGNGADGGYATEDYPNPDKEFSGSSGGAGTKDAISSYTETEKVGGGGGSGMAKVHFKASGGAWEGLTGNGGTPSGGDGGGGWNRTPYAGSDGVDGNGGGGGGGASGVVDDGRQYIAGENGGRGGNGSVRIRMHCRITA